MHAHLAAMNSFLNEVGAARFVPIAHDRDAGVRVLEVVKAVDASLTPAEETLLLNVAGCSPYLARLITKSNEDVLVLLRQPLSQTLPDVLQAAQAAVSEANADTQRMILRRAKNKAALATALADLRSQMSVLDVARTHSEFADAMIDIAFRAACSSGGIDPAKMSGIAIIAMGKHGGFEVNYSSDIDVIVVFDAGAMPTALRDEGARHAASITKTMIDLLHRQTADGYVYRMDLRLRPDPGVSPVAVSFAAAEAYYESFGQNWERMAFIRARACGGDLRLGQQFLKTLRPFVWRRYLDFASIDDVKAIKRQIHSSKGGHDVGFEGHDLKVGRGGIREVEFFAQTQQIILGGKDERLRVANTVEALEALLDAGQISAAQKDRMIDAYGVLRFLEHRIQMLNDEQTHKIPNSEEQIARLCAFCGFADVDEFQSRVMETLNLVRTDYDALFSAGADDDAATPSDVAGSQIAGSLVFTGVEDDADTIGTLASLGFQRPEDVSARIRLWHTGVIRATRNERARVLLTKLVNPLLAALAKASAPDDAFFSFDKFVSDLPAGVQVFSLLLNKPDVFDALIKIMTLSPYLGREFSRHTKYVELLIEDQWSQPIEPLCAPLTAPDQDSADMDYGLALEEIRQRVSEAHFLICAQLVTGLISPAQAQGHFTQAADHCLHEVQRAARAEMENQYGVLVGSLGIIAFGRLGAREMTAASDVDLVFVYDCAEDAYSSGPKSISASEYFGKLVRRIITGLSAPSRDGVLYEVDMQLRPTGRSGPAAVSLAAFQTYYENDAWTWEEMALCRARVSFADDAFRHRLETEITTILERTRDSQELVNDVNHMRARLQEEKPAQSVWDLKNTVGGLTDIIFICQFLNLANSAKIGPAPVETRGAIEWFVEHGLLEKVDSTLLLEAYERYNAVIHVNRAATGTNVQLRSMGEILRSRLCQLLEVSTIELAEQSLDSMQNAVSVIVEKIVVA